MNFNKTRFQYIPIFTSGAQVAGVKAANAAPASDSSESGGWLNIVSTLLPIAAGAYATVATANNGTYTPPAPASNSNTQQPVIIQSAATPATPAPATDSKKTMLYVGIAIAVIAVVAVVFFVFRKK